MNAPAPRVCLLGPPRFAAGDGDAWPDERRWRLAVLLAMADAPVHRDQLAALFWPDRNQAAARSNVRKLVMELRTLALPGLHEDGPWLHWPVASDVAALREAAASGDAAAVAAIAWAEPMQGLRGGDSPAFDHWLAEQRSQLRALWRQALLTGAATQPGPQALAWCQRLLADDPDDSEAAARVERLRPPPDEAADGLIGRQSEWQEAQALLAQRACRVLTLTGPGGIGKSALALALMRSGSPRLDLGDPLWLALEDLSTLDQVWPRLARELGAKPAAHSNGRDEALATLARQPRWLVLDNAEHLDGWADWVHGLLQAVPGMALLATSRTPLGAAGEWLLPMGPLDESAAIALFEREAHAASARHDPALDPVATRAVVHALGLLPLALKLAAPWTRHLPVATLHAQLRHALDLLEAERSPDERPEHATVRATFNRSWQFLDEGLRSALAALSVCQAPLHLDDAAVVAAARPAQLSALATQSLLTIDAAGRVSLHPLVRAFAAEQLDADGARAARDRHAAHWAARLRPYKDFNASDTTAALSLLASELPQVLQAWEHALDPLRPDWLEDMAPALSNHLQSAGGIAPVVGQLQRADEALALARPPAPTAQWRVGLEHAALRYWLSDYPLVEQVARRALQAARAVRHAPAIRMALNTLGLAAMRLGRLEEGAQRLGQALARARSDGIEYEVAAFAGNLSALLRELGRIDEAYALADESRRLHRTRGFVIGEVSALNELGLVAHQQGRLERAFEAYEEALSLVDRAGLVLRRPPLLNHMASVRLDQGRLDEALDILDRAMTQAQAQGLRVQEATARRLYAEVHLAQGHLQPALAQLREALALTPPEADSPAWRGLCASGACLARALGRSEVVSGLLSQHRRAVLLPRYAQLLDGLPPGRETPTPASQMARLQQLLSERAPAPLRPTAPTRA